MSPDNIIKILIAAKKAVEKGWDDSLVLTKADALALIAQMIQLQFQEIAKGYSKEIAE